MPAKWAVLASARTSLWYPLHQQQAQINMEEKTKWQKPVATKKIFRKNNHLLGNILGSQGGESKVKKCSYGEKYSINAKARSTLTSFTQKEQLLWNNYCHLFPILSFSKHFFSTIIMPFLFQCATLRVWKKGPVRIVNFQSNTKLHEVLKWKLFW